MYFLRVLEYLNCAYIIASTDLGLMNTAMG